MAAAMALGAHGVWCGSVWLTTEEAETPPAVKEKMLARHVPRHGPVPVPHRQARPAAPLRLDRRVGRAPTAPARSACRCQMIVAEGAMRPIGKVAEAGNAGARQLANYFVGQGVGPA